MAEIKLSAEAIEDLKKIKSYIAEELCNETAALHTISKITGSLRRLADFPQSGAPLASIVNLIRIIGTIHAETTPPFIAMKTESFMSPVFYMADETLYGFCLGNPKRTERIGGAFSFWCLRLPACCFPAADCAARLFSDGERTVRKVRCPTLTAACKYRTLW